MWGAACGRALPVAGNYVAGGGYRDCLCLLTLHLRSLGCFASQFAFPSRSLLLSLHHGGALGAVDGRLAFPCAQLLAHTSGGGGGAGKAGTLALRRCRAFLRQQGGNAEAPILSMSVFLSMIVAFGDSDAVSVADARAPVAGVVRRRYGRLSDAYACWAVK
jgi:hypothetical protein